MKLLTKPQIADIQDHSADFHYVQLMDFAARLNRALDLRFIREAFHNATENFWAVRRWEILDRFKSKHIPKPLQPVEGQEFLFPWQAESLDWRWDLGSGRRPKYFDFICASACHWMSSANYQLASYLFPEIDWSIVSNQYHTSVVCLENKLLFDLNYLGMNVPAPTAAEMLIKEPDAGIHFYEDASTYDCRELSITAPAVEFWSLMDQVEGTDEQKIALFRKVKQAQVITLTHDITTTEENIIDAVDELELYRA